MIDPIKAARLVERAYGSDPGPVPDLSDLGYKNPVPLLGVDLNGPKRYGFLAWDAAGDAVLAIRGTDDWEEWVRPDADFRLSSCPYGPGRVDAGFQTLCSTLSLAGGGRLASFSSVAGLVSVVAHSLGAALGRLIATRLRIPDLVTFGEPNVGDETFATWSAEAVPLGRRFRISGDPVPSVPPAIFGYESIGIPTTLAAPPGLAPAPADPLDLPGWLAHWRDHHALATYFAALSLAPANAA